MFIGDRTTSGGIDEEKLASSIAAKIKLPDIDSSGIVSSITNNSASLVSPLHIEHENIDTRIKDNVVIPLNTLTSNILRIYNTCNDINNKIDSGGGGGSSSSNIIPPLLLHEQYTTFSFKIKQYNYPSDKYEWNYVGRILEAKISMYEHYVTIEFYNGLNLRPNYDCQGFEMYLDSDDVIKSYNGKEDLLLQYYEKLRSVYPNDGAMSKCFPLKRTINDDNTKIIKYYSNFYPVIELDRDSNNRTIINFHLKCDGLDADTYQAIPPHLSITEYMDTGITECF